MQRVAPTQSARATQGRSRHVYRFPADWVGSGAGFRPMEAGIAPKGAARRRSAEETAAEMARLVGILGAMRQGLVECAAAATHDIQHHSFRGYRRFRQKLVEHAALLTLLRERLAARPDAGLAARVDEEEVRAA